VRRLYRERYLTRRLPDRTTFDGIHRHHPPGTGGRPRSTTPEEEECTAQDDLETATRTPYPYHLQRVQALSPAVVSATMRYQFELRSSVTL
jgi:hypothetical protein